MLVQTSDRDLKQRVLRELRWDSRVSCSSINVEVNDSVATLCGSVPTYAQKMAAQEAAHRVAGVLDVANDIDVNPSAQFMRGDTELARAVRSALEWDALLPDEQIHSTVSDGWVMLEGEVNNERERTDAERVIERLTGVVGVMNKLSIRRQVVDEDRLREEIKEPPGEKSVKAAA
jgi:osmotically-inducible protein OsmY